MAVTASAQSKVPAEALREERRALASVLRVIARERGPSPAFQREFESREDAGRTYVETRTLVLRSDDQRQLLALCRTVAKIEGVTCSDPRRAVRPPDAAFALLLIAVLLGMATLERSGFADEHVAMQPALVVLTGLALGFLGAAALLVGGGWPGILLHVSVALAFVPPIVWLVRVRVPWTACNALQRPYQMSVALTAVVLCTWAVRLASI
jgi:hypothetical protein